MKKVLALALSVAMMATLFVGCGNKTTEETPTNVTTEEATDSPTEEPAADAADTTAEVPAEHVTLKWHTCGNTVTDDAAVMEKVNEYLGEKLNVTLEPIWGTWGDFDQNAPLSLQSGDDTDIYFTCSWTVNEYNKYAKDGYFVRLDDPENNLIEQYAPDLWEVLPDVLTAGARIEGAAGKGVYAVPGFKDYATQNCWDVNVDLLEKYGYSLADVEEAGFYGFGEIFETVKAGEEAEGGTFYPFLIEGAVLERMVNNTIIVTGDAGSNNLLSLYFDPTDPSKEGPYGTTILNKFATDEYKAFTEKVHEYYQAGYIDPAMSNANQANDARTSAQLEGAYLIGTQSYAVGYEVQASSERGIHVEFVPTSPAYVDTTASQGALMAISAASKNPERAMMFLNLLNTDPYLMTLLNYGVEGVHYDLNDDGLVVFTEKRNDYMPWRNGMGNITMLPAQEGEGAGFWDSFKDYYATAISVPSLGWAFDQTPVETEVAALANIAAEYALSLSTGAVDPATAIPEFLEKLEANGMQKVVDEANAQLAAYLAN